MPQINYACIIDDPNQSLHWRQNERDGASNNRCHDCLLNCFFKRRSKKHQTSASMKHTQVVSTKCTSGFTCRTFIDTTFVCSIVNEHTIKCSRYKNNFTTNAQDIIHWNAFEYCTLNVTTTSHYSGVIMSAMASRFFAQLLVQAEIKENIKTPPHWHLWGESTGDRWIHP